MKNFSLYLMSFVVFTLVFSLTVLSYAESDADKTLSPYFLIKSDDPEVDQLPLLLTSAKVNIAGVIADVTVTQIYKNEGTRPLEAIYVFPGSTRAAVYGMTMTIGDRTIFAQIKEKQQARQTYEQAKREGKTASLLEQHRPNVFQMNVANILPGDNIKVELKYTELLVPTDGVYEFVYPTVVGPRYSNQNAATAPTSEQWVSNPYLLTEPGQELAPKEEPPYLFDITITLATGIPIQDVSCTSHKVNIDYKDPAIAAVTLDETIMIEKIKRMKPDHLERLKDALKELYVGEDFGNLPVFYTKLFAIGADYYRASEEQDEVVKTVKEFGGDRDYILKYRLAGGKIESGLLLYQGKPTPNPSQEGNNAGRMPALPENPPLTPPRRGISEEENFFLLMVQPPERVRVEDIPPREYIFIVDVSGSMHGFPLDISKTLLRDLISNLCPTDMFNVLLFAGGSKIMSEQSVPATPTNINRAIDTIDRQQGGGSTELLPALRRALALPRTEGVSRTVVIATDGYVHVELEAFDLIRNNLNNANMFTFGIGTSVNRFLIEGMARAGLGAAFVITDPRKAPGEAARFREYIQSPVLTQVTCAFDGFDVYDVEPVSIPDVLAERPVIVFGKWQGAPQGTITLSGFSGEGDYRQIFNVSEVKPIETNSALRYLWARKRIEILGDYNKLQSSDERVKEITSLGLTYNLLTVYTSFVAVDKEIRRKTDNLNTVKQPLPLPQGVSEYAVGGGSRKVPEPEMPFLLIIVAILLIIALRPESK